ncbi:MAG: hypothetical protein V3V78_05100 [Candidatus Woesearchaeota archaeon]
MVSIVRVAGIANLIFLFLVLASCRCVSIWGLNNLFNSEKYQKFYKYHCYYWYGLIISVVTHVIVSYI